MGIEGAGLSLCPGQIEWACLTFQPMADLIYTEHKHQHNLYTIHYKTAMEEYHCEQHVVVFTMIVVFLIVVYFQVK